MLSAPGAPIQPLCSSVRTLVTTMIPPTAEPLLPLWIALRANVRKILEGVTLADIAADALPEPVRALAAEPAAWENP